MIANIANGEARRLHPLTLVLAVLKLGPQSLNILPGLLAIGFVGRWVYVVPALAAYLLLSLAMRWMAWMRFRWRVDADDIAITQGIVRRNHRTIPFDRIQDVNIAQGPIQRLLQLATVGFETGASSGGKGDEATLESISLAEASALRDHIRTHRLALPAGDTAHAGAVATDGVPALAHGETLYAMTARRLLIAGLFNFSLAILAVLFGLLNSFDNFLPIKPFSPDFWFGLVRGTDFENWVAAHPWLALVVGPFLLALLGVMTGVVRMALANWGFRLERNDRGFRRTRGLLTRTDVVIPARRVQAALVEGALVERQFGWVAVKLQSLASDGDGKAEQDHLVAPLASLAEADAILADLGLDRAGLEDKAPGQQIEWQGTHPLPIFVVPAVLALVAIPVAIAVLAVQSTVLAGLDLPPRIAGNLWLAPVLLVAIALFLLALGWFQWSHSHWRFDGRVLHIAHGFRRRSHVILPARNIQSADIEIGPITRRFGLASLQLGVPGGRGSHHISTISESGARTLRAALLAAR